MLSRNVEFAQKFLHKGGWDARRRLYGTPKIEVLHHSQQEMGPEFVYRVPGPVYIEPVFGYIITEKGVLLEESMGLNWRNGLPSPADFFKRIKAGPDNIVQRDEVISLRRFWEWNYYHFHIDVLGKLELLNRSGVSRDVPLAVGRYVRQISFPAEILNYGRMATRRLIIPDLDNQQIIRADAVYYCQTQQNTRTRMDYLLDEMEVPVPDRTPTVREERRVFLIRRPPANRALANSSEIEAIVAKYGFETVDTAGMSIAEQVALFHSTRFLIAIHGAGMTNLIYRRGAAMSVLELHSDTYTSTCFLEMSEQYGYSHERLVGPSQGGNPQHADFRIDPALLEQKVRAMVADSS